jgi:hypothetical protein
MLDRRQFLGAIGAGLYGTVRASSAEANRLLIGAAWRGPAEGDAHQVGVLEVDWQSQAMRVRHAVPVPSRPHGLLAEADGALLAVALRPGRWLMRIDAQGGVVAQAAPDDAGRTTFGGHVTASRDGRWLYTTETHGADRHGRIGVRDARTLRKVDEWHTHGVEPHQLLLDAQGQLLVANGGIHRDADDRKRDLDRMDSSLVRLDARSGTLLGHWRLPDARLSIRHLALCPGAEGLAPLLGLALQAEHDDPLRRAEAPALAVWDGASLSVPARQAAAAGYAGDIAAVDGGFVFSNALTHRAWQWRAQRPDVLTEVVQLQRAYALAPWRASGVIVAAARGLGRWHPTQAPALVPWPAPMALDNHWVSWESVS